MRLLFSRKTIVLALYHERQKSKDSPVGSPKGKALTTPKEEAKDDIKEEMEKPIPEKPKVKVKGYYSLQAQVTRYEQIKSILSS